MRSDRFRLTIHYALIHRNTDRDNVRFRGPDKTFDTIAFRSENCHDRYCRYHFSYNFAKKERSAEPIFPLIT